MLSSSNLVGAQTDLSNLRSAYEDEVAQHGRTKMALGKAELQLGEGKAELNSAIIQHDAEVQQLMTEVQQAQASKSAQALTAQASTAASTAATREGLIRKKVQALQQENEMLKRQLAAPSNMQPPPGAYWGGGR